MPKVNTGFTCKECGQSYSKWIGRCTGCDAWNSLEESVVKSGRITGRVSAKPARLAEVDSQKRQRLASGIAEFDQVLGGGVVPGSVILLAGDPGVGKSTLVLQFAADMASKQTVLYVSGEESASQIKLRAERLNRQSSQLDLITETDAESVAAMVAGGQYSLVIVDSIQTIISDNLPGTAGSIGQITNSAALLQRAAKDSGTALVMIGHVTKEGNIAGPKVLEHLVDVVLYLEGDTYGHFKALRGIKNRFGSINEAGIFEMTDTGLKPVPNPSAALLKERQPGPGSVVYAAMEGSRPLLVEVQALVSTTVFGYPKRTAVGFDINRLNLLLAVITKRAGINLSNQDVYVNIVGGLKLTEPAADLAIILSIVSAYKNREINQDSAVFGEVGLNGEVRSVMSAQRRLAEAKKQGFKSAIGPKSSNTAGIIGVRNITEATNAILES